MKKIINLLLVLVLLIALNSCQNKKSDDKIESTISSEYDTLGVYKLTDSVRSVFYTTNQHNGYTKSIDFYQNTVLVGNIKNERFDGKYYLLDSFNNLMAILYYVNGQEIYSHTFSREEIHGDEVKQIDSENIKLIRPPLLQVREVNDSIYALKLIGTNYPLVLSRVSYDSHTTHIKGDFKRDFIEESIRLSLMLDKKPLNITFEYADCNENVIKRYKWSSEDKDKIFKEVTL